MSAVAQAMMAEAATYPPTMVLELRAEARAWLWWKYQCEMDEAVDPLQEFAEHSGLVDTIGQDAVQRIISAAFDRLRAIAAAEEERRDRLWAQRQLPEPPQRQARQHHTARSTEDAFFYVLRQGNADQLAAWLADHPRDVAHLHAAWKSKCSTQNK